jgi:hypothetical protein
MKYFKCLLR